MKYLLLSVFIFCSLFEASYAKKGDKKNQLKSVQGELLVKLNPESESKFNKDISSLNYEVVKKLNLSAGTFYLIRTNSKNKISDEKAIIKQIENIDGVFYAEPNFIYTINDESEGVIPNDPKFGQLWGLRNSGRNEPTRGGGNSGVEGRAGADIAALKAWDVTKGDKKIKIAVIDTGIDYNHEDLKDNIFVNKAELNGKPGVDDDHDGFIDDVHGWNFNGNNNNPMDGHGHGTHCAGTIGARHNNIGVAGVMDEVTLVPIKFLGDDGSGSTEAAISAIDYAIKLKVDIMSNSWGGGGYSKALEDVIKEANKAGIIFVAAAGNDSENNDSSDHYPSNYNIENVIAVAAHDSSDNLASFSNYGKEKVLVAAPGKNILSTVKDNGYDVYSGTSMAAPHVSGALGLLLSKEGRMPMSEIRERLVATATKVNSLKSKVKSRGRLNAYNLVTDTRPSEPAPINWIDYPLTEAFETKHPYDNNVNLSKVFKVPGAKYVRVVVQKFDLENKYDILKVQRPGTREESDLVTGTGDNYVSESVEGDSLELNFVSDTSVTKWGFRIEKLQYSNVAPQLEE